MVRRHRGVCAPAVEFRGLKDPAGRLGQRPGYRLLPQVRTLPSGGAETGAGGSPGCFRGDACTNLCASKLTSPWDSRLGESWKLESRWRWAGSGAGDREGAERRPGTGRDPKGCAGLG